MGNRKILFGWLTGLVILCLVFGAFAAPELKESTKNGKVVRREWTDESGNTVTGPEGYAYVTLSYSGTTVTEKYFDAEGQPAEVTGGYYGRMLTYGNKHRLEEVVYLDADGKKANCGMGYARLRMSYTSLGGMTSAVYYDENGDWVMVPSLGYAAVKSEFRGPALTKRTYLNEKRNPVDTPMGYAVQIQKVNKSNRVLAISFQHADGSPAVCPEGWASCKREVDDKNREISVRYFDLSGTMMDIGLGYAYEVRTWTDDRTCVVKRYDLQDAQIAMGDGYAAVQRNYNKEGLLIREVFLDASGSATANGDGVTECGYSYDEDGRLEKVLFLDASGKPTENRAGYAGYRDMLDADGFVTSRVFLGVDGKAADTAAGYSEVRYLYDENRQLTGTEYYDVNGALIKKE